MIDVDNLVNELVGRGIKLAAPATVQDLDLLKKAYSLPVPNIFFEIYERFNGFDDDFDEKSFISVWPISRSLAKIAQGDVLLPFADVSFDSIILAISLVAQGNPIVESESGKVAFASFIEFWQALASGSTEF